MTSETDTSATAGEVLDRLHLGWVTRSSSDRMISGLSGGVAHHLGVGSAYVRAAFITLSFAGLLGVFLYAAGWLIAGDAVTTGVRSNRRSRAELAGLGFMFLGLLFALRSAGLWFGAATWAVAAASFGSAVLWDRGVASDPGETGLLPPSRGKRLSGAVLVVTGLAFVASGLDSLSQIGPAAFGATVAAVGVVLIFGPRISELGAQLSAERRDRIASEERAKLAADLHDSVLQSLAMIQRSEDPARMVTIARAQERELRSWLYGKSSEAGVSTLTDALQRVADRVEHDHDVPVDVVVVNDRPVDGLVEPLVKAAGEAMLNAARHSQAPRVSVFAEILADRIDVFVSDTGTGFVPDDVADDRHGLRHSVVGRMEHHGGTASVSAQPGEGTEVHLSLPFGDGR